MFVTNNQSTYLNHLILPLDKTNIKVSMLHKNVGSIRYYKMKSQSETILNLHENSFSQDKQPTQ